MIAQDFQLERLAARQKREEVRLAVGVQLARQALHQVVHRIVVQVQVQPALAFEVMEQQRLGHARLARDVVHRRLLVGVAREYGEARVQHDVLPIFGQREELLVHVAPSFPDAPVGRRPIAWSPLTRSVNDARAAYHH